MKKAIVGFTGFVGSNICSSTTFDEYYNSKNIENAFGTNPDLLVYSGVRAEMFTANSYPEKDLENIIQAIDNIKRINPKKLVLISTISVYPTFDGDETTIIDNNISAYGKHRRCLERWVEDNFNDSLIIRLPALYGQGIKKNFIFDMIHFIPVLLKTQKYDDLFKGSDLSGLYKDRGDGFYKCIAESKEDRNKLKSFFLEAGFSALNFTDSRSEYQYFNLRNLWNIITKALKQDIRLLTIATEPISSSELYEYIYRKPFVNECATKYPVEHLKSIYAEIFGGENGYLYNKQQLLEDIKRFVNEQMNHD